MKYVAIIKNFTGETKFEFEAKSQKEFEEKKRRFVPVGRTPNRETIYIYGIDNTHFEQIF